MHGHGDTYVFAQTPSFVRKIDSVDGRLEMTSGSVFLSRILLVHAIRVLEHFAQR